MKSRDLLAVAAVLGAILYYLGPGETKVKAIIEGKQDELDLGGKVDAVSDRVGIDRNILRAIVAQESGWVPTAKNRLSKDYGLTQINIKTASSLRPDLVDQMPDILLDVDTNLSMAESLLREIIRAVGSSPDAIFNSWNIGWPSYKKGKISPYLAKYQAKYQKYKTTGEA